MFGGWGPDWSNASTVLPELFGSSGGFNLSYYDDEEFQTAIADAQGETDRAAQSEQWHEISRQSVEQALVAPWLFGKEQRVWGSGLQDVEYWPAYGSYIYTQISVAQ